MFMSPRPSTDGLGSRMFRSKTVSAHSAETSVSTIVFVRHVCSRMGRFIRTCNVCRRATWAESSVLGDIFDLRIIYNFSIISASLVALRGHFACHFIAYYRLYILLVDYYLRKTRTIFYYFLVNIGGLV